MEHRWRLQCKGFIFRSCYRLRCCRRSRWRSSRPRQRLTRLGTHRRFPALRRFPGRRQRLSLGRRPNLRLPNLRARHRPRAKQHRRATWGLMRRPARRQFPIPPGRCRHKIQARALMCPAQMAFPRSRFGPFLAAQSLAKLTDSQPAWEFQSLVTAVSDVDAWAGEIAMSVRRQQPA
jgi:hypothetical protein